MSAVLEILDLAKRGGDRPRLAPLSLKLHSGMIHVLFGALGAGKTTLLRLLAGLERADGGSIELDGEPLNTVPGRRRDVGMVYQQIVNYPNLSVFENIASPLRVAGVDGDEIDTRVRETAALLALDDLFDRRPDQLSGGQRQRTAIARALVRKPRLLLLDEPLSSLDLKLRERLREELREVLAKSQSIVVYATADPREALDLGGQIAVLDHGRLLQHGPTLETWRQPASQRVARVLSDPPINLIDAHLSEGELVLAGQRITLPDHARALGEGDCRIGVRAHRLGLWAGEAGIVLDCRVELAEIGGSTTRLHLRLDREELIAEVVGVQSPELGAELSVCVQGDDILFFSRDGSLLAAP